MAISKRPRTREDLVEIWEYIAEDSVNHADSLIDSIEAKLKTLAAQPLIGRARDDLAIGLRSFPIGRYILFYMPLNHFQYYLPEFIEINDIRS